MNDYPDPPKGVKWPNHLHTEAKYPCSNTRRQIMHDVLTPESEETYGHTDHESYPFVMEAMHELLSKSDAYLFRQYYHRDIAIQALNDGDVSTALKHLHEIGV